MDGKGARDLRVAALACAQHGVASRAQLVGLGLTPDEIDGRLARGRLHRLHQGVYAVGHTVLKAEGRWMAATLASGGVLSHATAAAAWELLPIGATIHVTVPGYPGRKRRAGIRIHRSTTLEPHDTTTHRGIPVTTPIRTLLDLASTTKGRRLEELLDRAEPLIDFAELRHRRSPPSLQAVLSSYSTVHTRSELEEAFLRLCDDHGIRRPETNTRIEGFEVDFAWRDARLIVEVDGFAFHRSRHVFTSDREKTVILTIAGWRVLRFTYEQVTDRPAWVAWSLRRADERLGG